MLGFVGLYRFFLYDLKVQGRLTDEKDTIVKVNVNLINRKND